MTEVHHLPKSYFNPMYAYPYCAGMNTPAYYPSYRPGYHQNNYPSNQNAFLHSYPVAVDNAPRFESLDERVVKDHGARPYVVNIDKVTKQNNTYRTAIWTGKHFQVTVMSINVRDDIGLEVHPHTDQFIRIEEGQGLVQMGDTRDRLTFQEKAYDGYAIMIPAGKWHNVINTGNKPLKIYVIYAPPHHPFGTVQQTKAMAMTPHSRLY